LSIFSLLKIEEIFQNIPFDAELNGLHFGIKRFP